MAGYQYTWEYYVTLPSCGASSNGGTTPSASGSSLDEGAGAGSSSLLPDCGVWVTVAGDGAVYSYKSSTSHTLTIRVTAWNGTANVTKQKTVCVGNCNGGGSGAVSSDAVTASVETAESSGAPVFAFEPAFPNPAGLSANGRARMTMRFNLPESAPARLSLYDALGREVAVLLDDIAHEGTTDVSFDVATLPAGVYTARLAAGDRVAIQRMTVVR